MVPQGFFEQLLMFVLGFYMEPLSSTLSEKGFSRGLQIVGKEIICFRVLHGTFMSSPIWISQRTLKVVYGMYLFMKVYLNTLRKMVPQGFLGQLVKMVIFILGFYIIIIIISSLKGRTQQVFFNGMFLMKCYWVPQGLLGLLTHSFLPLFV